MLNVGADTDRQAKSSHTVSQFSLKSTHYTPLASEYSNHTLQSTAAAIRDANQEMANSHMAFV